MGATSHRRGANHTMRNVDTRRLERLGSSCNLWAQKTGMSLWGHWLDNSACLPVSQCKCYLLWKVFLDCSISRWPSIIFFLRRTYFEIIANLEKICKNNIETIDRTPKYLPPTQVPRFTNCLHFVHPQLSVTALFSKFKDLPHSCLFVSSVIHCLPPLDCDCSLRWLWILLQFRWKEIGLEK